jgi:hypothetical protein
MKKYTQEISIDVPLITYIKLIELSVLAEMSPQTFIIKSLQHSIKDMEKMNPKASEKTEKAVQDSLL